MSKPSPIRIMPGPGERDPRAILECAKNADLERCIVVGRDASGVLWISASDKNEPQLLWDLMAAAGTLELE